MAFSGGLGAEIDLEQMPTIGKLKTEKLLFSESQSRFLVEATDPEDFKNIMAGTAFVMIGRTTGENVLKVFRGKKEVLNVDIDLLKRSWGNGL
jgi:phosphoribosylformylglycinamidine synthase